MLILGKAEDKATVTCRRKASGDVIGEIINEKGEIVTSKNFGMMPKEEYRRVLKLMEQEFPDIGQSDIFYATGARRENK